jgi:phosphate transport system substrate-binding protein
MKKLFLGLVVFGALLSSCASVAPGNGSIPAATAASAYIQNKGSDTMVNLALAWAEAYQQVHPDVRISVTGGGSGTGMAALINGTVDLANASRKIKPEEIKQADSNGIQHFEFVVARDAIAVIVNPHNPVSQLTMQQISLIYKGQINNWREVGGENRPIVRLSRESNSGTHVYFLEAVIRLGNSKDKNIFSPNTLLLPSSEGIIAETSTNPNAIGYDGLGYVTPEVKVVAVARKAGETYTLPSAETVNNLAYPISRDLYMYAGKKPEGATKDYLDWILSDAAQQIVIDLGFVPVVSSPVNK